MNGPPPSVYSAVWNESKPFWCTVYVNQDSPMRRTVDMAGPFLWLRGQQGTRTGSEQRAEQDSEQGSVPRSAGGPRGAVADAQVDRQEMTRGRRYLALRDV